MQTDCEDVEAMIDPDMPSQELRLHMGELTAQEERTARAAIRWANSQAKTFVAASDARIAELEDLLSWVYDCIYLGNKINNGGPAAGTQKFEPEKILQEIEPIFKTRFERIKQEKGQP